MDLDFIRVISIASYYSIFKMKILIEGDIDEAKLIKIGKFLVRMYAGKKEHINFLIVEGMEEKSRKKVMNVLEEMWKK